MKVLRWEGCDNGLPKDTFNNLSEGKKQKIFLSAVKEFSTRRFSEASINQIVKVAGISRGSFYQYFNDKEDLFLYMLAEISKEKRNVILSGEAIDRDADFLEAYMKAMKNSLQWGKTKPEYARISMMMEIDDSAFITGLRKNMTKGLIELIERDKKRSMPPKFFHGKYCL